MAYAALQLVARRYNRATMWEQLEQQLKQQGSQPAPAAKRRPAVASRSGGFVSGW
jgi:hypothetical protein